MAEQFQHSFGGSRKDVGFPVGTVDTVLSKGQGGLASIGEELDREVILLLTVSQVLFTTDPGVP